MSLSLYFPQPVGKSPSGGLKLAEVSKVGQPVYKAATFFQIQTGVRVGAPEVGEEVGIVGEEEVGAEEVGAEEEGAKVVAVGAVLGAEVGPCGGAFDGERVGDIVSRVGE
jgi:hypothetical protein